MKTRAMTKTKLNRMGYRKGLDCYYKTRGWYDVTSTERGNTESSVMLKGLKQLKQWEAFAFCS